jgi:hypothetical protein
MLRELETVTFKNPPKSPFFKGGIFVSEIWVKDSRGSRLLTGR